MDTKYRLNSAGRAVLACSASLYAIGKVLELRFVEDLRRDAERQLGPNYRQRLRDASGINAIQPLELATCPNEAPGTIANG